MRPGQVRLLLLLVGCLGLGACVAHRQEASRPPPDGQVEVTVLAPAGEGSHRLGPGQTARGGQPDLASAVLPKYPAQWIAHNPGEVRVDARVVVDAEGEAAPAELAVSAAGCNDRCSEAFVEATRVALREWRFEPLEIMGWIDGPDSDGDGEPDTVQRGVLQRLPYTRRLRFVFSLRDGRPEVGVSHAQP